MRLSVTLVLASLVTACAHPLVALPERQRCIQQPDVEPCALTLEMDDGLRLRLEPGDIAWLRVAEPDTPDDGDPPLARLSLEQIESAAAPLHMHVTLHPADAAPDTLPGWTPGPTAATVRPWQPPSVVTALVHADLLGRGAISLAGTVDGMWLVIEVLEGEGLLELEAERVHRSDIIEPYERYRPPPSIYN